MSKKDLENTNKVNQNLMQDFEDFWIDEIIEQENINKKKLDNQLKKDINNQKIDKFWKELWKKVFENPKEILKKENKIKNTIPTEKKVFSKENKVQKINKDIQQNEIHNHENKTFNTTNIISNWWEQQIEKWNQTIVVENKDKWWTIIQNNELSWKQKEWNFFKETVKEQLNNWNKDTTSDSKVIVWNWWNQNNKETIEKIYQEKIPWKNEIWDWKIIEENIKIEWWSHVDLNPWSTSKKETVDTRKLFTQEESFQQLKENKEIEKKIQTEWNEIWSEQEENNQWKEVVKEKITEVEKVFENKNNVQEKSSLPIDQKQENISPAKKWKIPMLWTNDLWNVDFEEEIKKEWNKLWKNEKIFKHEQLEDISKTLNKDSKFISVIKWIDQWTIKWPLSNEVKVEFEKEVDTKLFWNYENTKEILENQQLKDQWKFAAKLVSSDNIKEISEYQYFEKIRDLLSYLNFSLSKTAVWSFWIWYIFLVVVYTVLWIISVKWWFVINWLWKWFWWILFWWLLIFLLSQFSHKKNWEWEWNS